ncbi:TPA: hypothetical protein ACH3X2_002018 [Trebouxia sp. C0005]
MDTTATTTATMGMGMVRAPLGLPLAQELVGMEAKALDRAPAQALAVAQAVGMARAAPAVDIARAALAQALVVLAPKELELGGLDHMELDHMGLEVVDMARAAMVLTLVQVLVGMEAKELGLVLELAQGLGQVLGLELASTRVLSMTRVVGRLMTGVPCRRSRTSSPLGAMLASTPRPRLHTACSSF